MQEYRWHEPSREAIELAYEAIIAKDLKVGHAEVVLPVIGHMLGGSVPAGPSFWVDEKVSA